MSGVTDYRVPQARSHRLHAESLRLDAASTRMYAERYMGAAHLASLRASAESKEKTAAHYDRMAAELEAEIAADAAQVAA